MRFKAGDIIKVYSAEGDQIIGKALQSRSLGGLAHFSVLQNNGRVLEFNLNYDQYEVIYSDPFPDYQIALMMENDR